MEFEEVRYGTEAIRRLYVEDFPVIVANDIYGGDIFEEGRKRFARIDIYGVIVKAF